MSIKTECRVEGSKHICGDPHWETTKCECTAYCGNDDDEKICHHFDSRTKGCNNKFAWPEYIDMNYFKAREEIGKKRWNNCVKSDGKHICRDETGHGCDHARLVLEACVYAMIDIEDNAGLILCDHAVAKKEAEDWTEDSYTCRNKPSPNMSAGLYIASHDDVYIADATIIKRDTNWEEYPKLADIFYNRPCKNLLWLELAHLVRSLQKK